MQIAYKRYQKPAIKTELKVNGHQIELNNFIQDFMPLAITVMIKSLRSVTDVQSISRLAGQ
ncbi:MAG: hypothetical protein AMJ65_02875 [Phycisphaerae bacterium SG8_4]|nr:MAG: hypothetical protein AMJ65_02875 [Phycisphaerae bacterium SG8_4]